MTTINQIVKAVETIDKSTTGLANAQCKLGQLLSSYKSERCESIKPKEFYGEIESPVIEKFGPIAHDEAAVFVPALALGGNEDVENMEVQKLLPHLMILSQL